MKARVRMLMVAALAVVATACGGPPSAPPMRLAAENPLPPGASEITTTPNERGDDSCNPTASLRPGVKPAPGVMPAGSTMAAILATGKLRVGVDQNQFLFGYRNPTTGQIEGFDIDIAREIARDLFGDPDKVELYPIESAHRALALQNKEVDIVVQTFSATCERRRDIEFSSTYFVSEQRVLATKGSGIRSAADLAGKRVCGVFRTTTLEAVFSIPQHPRVIGMTNWLDCLTAMQQGQVDAISTDAPILYGLAAQDPNLEVVGDPLAFDAYAVGVQKQAGDFVRFVNGVLDRVRNDGTWQRIYTTRLAVLGPAPAPPAPRYLD
ncbi:glutamate ABC transporter substrate-binding protein [Nocardia jejuensis]|uniref:glutamate ABC transporter substrate-binding protein n=1 Tax=Nocardia jejuensis TaxID=328049 RepID=UPI00082C8576|nr:glutamate ABC transporter substrate-binding protein [Nocardia jejuensis]